MLLDSKNILFENDMGSLYIQATIFCEHDICGIHQLSKEQFFRVYILASKQAMDQ